MYENATNAHQRSGLCLVTDGMTVVLLLLVQRPRCWSVVVIVLCRLSRRHGVKELGVRGMLERKRQKKPATPLEVFALFPRTEIVWKTVTRRGGAVVAAALSRFNRHNNNLEYF